MSFLDEKGVERVWHNVRENFLKKNALNGIYEEFDFLADALFSEINSIKEQVPVDKLLRNLGHYSDKGSLPSDGQESGTQDSNYPITHTVDITQGTISIPNVAYKYKMGVMNNTGSNNAYLYVATNYPETIETIAIGNYGSFEIRINPTPEKPVAIYASYYNRAGVFWMPDSFTGYYKARDNQKENGTFVSEPGYITGMVGNANEVTVFGNLPHSIKYAKHDYYRYARTSTDLLGYSYNELSDSYGYSYTLGFNENYYTYNEGMQILRFDENYQAYWVLADSEVETNDLATVGENNELYVVNSNGKWEQWHKVDCYTKEEINAMLGEIENVLDEILTGDPSESTPEIPDVG